MGERYDVWMRSVDPACPSRWVLHEKERNRVENAAAERVRLGNRFAVEHSTGMEYMMTIAGHPQPDGIKVDEALQLVP